MNIHLISIHRHDVAVNHWGRSGQADYPAVVMRGQALLGGRSAAYVQLDHTGRTENPACISLVLTEVQVGAYLGEDAFVRLEDKYDRHDERRKDE